MKKLTKLISVMFVLTLCFTLVTPVKVKAANIKKPAKVTSVKKSSVTANSIKITYKKAARAKGYQVQYSTKSSMKSAKTRKTSKTSATIKSLKANTTYYIRVRAYNTASKKTQYGDWSKVVKIKTAKKAVAAHTHKWVNKTVVDKKAWDETVTTRKAYTEYKYILKGLRDNVYGTFYPVTPSSDTDDAWHDALYAAGQDHADVFVPYAQAIINATRNATSNNDLANAEKYIMDAISGMEPASALAKPVIEKRAIYHPVQTKVIHHAAVTHTETICRTCSKKKTHTHKWVTKTVVDKGAWDETVVVKEGYEIERQLESSIYVEPQVRKSLDAIENLATGELYYNQETYTNGAKIYDLCALLDGKFGTSMVNTLQLQPFGASSSLTEPLRPEWIPAETEVVHHKAVTHKEKLCSICGVKK